MSKRHPLYFQIIKDIKLLFRDPKDSGKNRTLPTPTSDILEKRLDTFIAKWKVAEVQGSHILTDKVKKELASLRVHVLQGCLSNIPAQAGTNRNENLHRCINPFFRRCRMGIPLAVALLTILFHHRNNKSGSVSPILSARASYKRRDTETEDHHVQFGIIQKSESPYINSWIFGPRLHCNVPNVSPDELTEVYLSPDIENIVSITNTGWCLEVLPESAEELPMRMVGGGVQCVRWWFGGRGRGSVFGRLGREGLEGAPT